MKKKRDIFEGIVTDILMDERENQLYPCDINCCNTMAENILRLKKTIKKNSYTIKDSPLLKTMAKRRMLGGSAVARLRD